MAVLLSCRRRVKYWCCDLLGKEFFVFDAFALEADEARIEGQAEDGHDERKDGNVVRADKASGVEVHNCPTPRCVK